MVCCVEPEYGGPVHADMLPLYIFDFYGPPPETSCFFYPKVRLSAPNRPLSVVLMPLSGRCIALRRFSCRLHMSPVFQAPDFEFPAHAGYFWSTVAHCHCTCLVFAEHSQRSTFHFRPQSWVFGSKPTTFGRYATTFGVLHCVT